jgi:hypothetical protein
VNDACIKANAGNEWRCNFAAYTYQHIKSSIFPLVRVLLGSRLTCGF